MSICIQSTRIEATISQIKKIAQGSGFSMSLLFISHYDPDSYCQKPVYVNILTLFVLEIPPRTPVHQLLCVSCSMLAGLAFKAGTHWGIFNTVVTHTLHVIINCTAARTCDFSAHTVQVNRVHVNSHVNSCLV